jgi:hypothetical protein
MNRTRSDITENELARRLHEDAATWRIVPPADLRRRTMRTIVHHEQPAAAPARDSMRRAGALLAACVTLAASALLALQLQAPRGDRSLTASLNELRATVDEAQARAERVQAIMGRSSLQDELLAIATDVESLTASMYRRVEWLDLREN